MHALKQRVKGWRVWRIDLRIRLFRFWVQIWRPPVGAILPSERVVSHAVHSPKSLRTFPSNSVPDLSAWSESARKKGRTGATGKRAKTTKIVLHLPLTAEM